MVQHMAKFTSRVVFLHVQFKKLAKTHVVPHSSEPIACVGPVYVNLRFSQLCTGVIHMSCYEANESGLDLTRHAN